MNTDRFGWIRLVVWATFLLLAIQSLNATTVTATVADANGNPYASGTVAASLTGPSGVAPQVGSLTINASSGPFNLTGAGTFSITLTDTSTITSGAFKWVLTICANSVNLGPAAGLVRVCFNSAPLTITGSSLNITGSLSPASLGPVLSASIVGLNNTWTGLNGFSQGVNFLINDGSPPFTVAGGSSQVANLDAATTGAFDHTPTGCTNQAATSVAPSGNLGCSTVTSAFVDTSIANTSADINSASQVTATHLAAALPVAQGGTGVAASTGTTSVVLSNGPTLTNPSLTSASTLKWNADTGISRDGANIIDFGNGTFQDNSALLRFQSVQMFRSAPPAIFATFGYIWEDSTTNRLSGGSSVSNGSIVFPASVDTFTNKTYDTAGAGNTFKVGSAIYPSGAPATNQAVVATGATTTSWQTVIPTLTLKKGTGAGNYSSSSTSYVVVDATNLTYTVTIPSTSKLMINVAGGITTSTAVATASVNVTDGTCGVGTVLQEIQVNPTVAGTAGAEQFALTWILTGDGASHTVNLCYKTSAGADAALILNSSGTLLPSMTFMLSSSL